MLKDQILAFRELNGQYKFHIYCYTLGKEEVFVNLAKDFETKVKISKDRWNRLNVIGIAREHFQTHEELESWPTGN